LNHTGLGLAIVIAILWCVVAYRERQYFSSLFVQKTS
jgi:hypothetical protein